MYAQRRRTAIMFWFCVTACQQVCRTLIPRYKNPSKMINIPLQKTPLMIDIFAFISAWKIGSQLNAPTLPGKTSVTAD